MARPSDDLDGLWVFDGVCNFCSGSVQTIVRIDRQAAIRFTPLQSPFGLAIAERYGLDSDNPTSFLFFDQGRALEASDAVIALLRRLPPPWRWLSILRLVPKRWRDAGYGWIARNRYRLMGKRQTCMIPAPELRGRFLIDLPT